MRFEEAERVENRDFGGGGMREERRGNGGVKWGHAREKWGVLIFNLQFGNRAETIEERGIFREKRGGAKPRGARREPSRRAQHGGRDCKAESRGFARACL